MSTSGSDPTVQLCTSCGSAIQPTDQFCRSCGAPLGAAGTARVPDGNGDDELGISLAAPGSLPHLPADPTEASEPLTLEQEGPAAEQPWWRRPVVLLAACGAAAVLLVIIVAVAVVSSGGGGGGTTEGPDLANGRSVAVALDGNTDDARTHEARLTRGNSATVFVTGDPSFDPTVSVTSPEGDDVDIDLIRLANNGNAATFTATESGKYRVEVAGFLDDQESYDVEFRKARFVTPEQLAVGDCVTRIGDEEWARVSGFMIRPCDRAHDGQVFEQVPDFTDNDSEAQTQCDVARNQRIRLPGYVHWRAYYGDDLTCIVVRGNGSQSLNRSMVTP